MEKNRKAGELLMPAGGLKQYIAAVENGADAVYIGGKVFSARAGAENFSDEEAEKAMDYGHLRGVKTYVTMNTLMEEKDLYPALRPVSYTHLPWPSWLRKTLLSRPTPTPIPDRP